VLRRQTSSSTRHGPESKRLPADDQVDTSSCVGGGDGRAEPGDLSPKGVQQGLTLFPHHAIVVTQAPFLVIHLPAAGLATFRRSSRGSGSPLVSTKGPSIEGEDPHRSDRCRRHSSCTWRHAGGCRITCFRHRHLHLASAIAVGPP
jgi:hypothetical protein